MSDFTLVTGGAGFVGKALVAKLRAQGERVRSFDLAPPAHEDDRQGSVTDEKAVVDAMEGVSSVFHLAGHAALWARDADAIETVNVRGTEVVVAAAQKVGVEKFVFCSSLTTLVGEKTPIGKSSADETISLSPAEMLGPYPRSKRDAEIVVEKAAADGLGAVIVLPTEPLGPGDDSLTPPTQMILDFANGKTPAYIDCILNFVPVESLADGFIAARDKGRQGERYLLGGENTPMAQLLAMIEEITGRKMPTSKLPYWVALTAGVVDTHVMAAVTGKSPKAPLTGVRLAGRQVSFSSEKAARELNWRASPVGVALRQALDWAKTEGLLD